MLLFVLTIKHFKNNSESIRERGFFSEHVMMILTSVAEIISSREKKDGILLLFFTQLVFFLHF